MHSVQTIAAPPNHGRICLARMGWTRKRRKAERKIVAACSGMARSILARPRMLTVLVRISLLAELLAYVVLGAWLVARRGWSVGEAATVTASSAFALRLGVVLLTSAHGWLYRSPRAAAHRLGLVGTLR